MKRKFIESNYQDLLEIINSIKVGIFVTDGEGNTLLVNDVCCRSGGMGREEIEGKNVDVLVKEGLMEESVTRKAINSRKIENLRQTQGDGSVVFSTATPVFSNGDIEYVITTERDITELETVKGVLSEKEENTGKLLEEIEYLKEQRICSENDIIAEDDASLETVEKALNVAKHDMTILLQGESGVGKEVYADLIYKNSMRSKKPFIKVNCAAIPENLMESEMFGYVGGAFSGAEKNGKIGWFELADGGTLFLDEIGDMPLSLQPKLLRALQEKEIYRVGGTKAIPVDIRLIASTNVPLEEAVENGTFRGDLYYRINVMPIEILPLRKRKKDIKPLTQFYIQQFNSKYKTEKTITAMAIKKLEEYKWPGNVRELRNIIERCMVSFKGNEINQFQIERILYPHSKRQNMVENDEMLSLEQMLENYERQIISEYMGKYKSVSKVAEALLMNRTTLFRRMKKYDLK